jgi:hypothetical protein
MSINTEYFIFPAEILHITFCFLFLTFLFFSLNQMQNDFVVVFSNIFF